MTTPTKYIPALRFEWLTPLYDPFLKWGMREEVFKRNMIQQAQILPGMRVLDLGCGTGTLTVLIKQLNPEAEVIGIDGDPAVLELARSKAEQAGVNITLDYGMAFHLSYPNISFDRVLSSLVMHHLNSENKMRTLCEVYRVLRPGGEFYMIDFGKPRSLYARIISLAIRRLEKAEDNILGLLPGMLANAGFNQVEETLQYNTIMGQLSQYSAKKLITAGTRTSLNFTQSSHQQHEPFKVTC